MSFEFINHICMKVKHENMFLALSAIIFASAVAFPQTNETEVEMTTKYVYKPPKIGGCKLPGSSDPKPPHGHYELVSPPFVEQGQEFDDMTLKLVCDKGYGIEGGRPNVFCHYGFWSWNSRLYRKQTECTRFCEIPNETNMEYRCPVKVMPPRCFLYKSGGTLDVVPCPIPEGADKGYRMCKDYEPNGVVVQPVCKSGCNNETFTKMTCQNGRLVARQPMNIINAFNTLLICTLSNKCF